MAAWIRLEGLPEGVGVLFSNGLAFDEGWTLEPAVEPPEVTSGWLRVKRRSVEVAIRADGALSFPEATHGAFAAGSAPAEGQGGIVGGVKGGAGEGQDERPRQILVHDGDVQRLASALPSQGHLVVVADRRAPAGRVRELRAITPDSVTMSLAVSRTSKAVVAAFAQRWPRVPGWLVPRLHRASESANGNRVLAGAELLLLLKDRIGSCAAIDHAFELVRAGAGMDVLGQVLAEALQSCTCRGMDVDAVETIAAFSTLPISTVGVAKVWASDARAWGQLPADGTVSDLAAALTRE